MRLASGRAGEQDERHRDAGPDPVNRSGDHRAGGHPYWSDLRERGGARERGRRLVVRRPDGEASAAGKSPGRRRIRGCPG